MSRLVRGAVRLRTAVKIKRRHQLAPCGDEFLKLLGLREGGAPLGHVPPAVRQSALGCQSLGRRRGQESDAAAEERPAAADRAAALGAARQDRPQ